MLIFWKENFLTSHVLSIKVILQPVSKYTEVLGLCVASSIIGSNVIAVVEYVYLLNTRLELRADNFAIE